MTVLLQSVTDIKVAKGMVQDANTGAVIIVNCYYY